MRYVLDASALFSRHIPENNCYITPEVVLEIKDQRSKDAVEGYISAGKIIILTASEDAISTVQIALKTTGDNISGPDMSIIALAIDKNATIISDDYGIQNVASTIGVSWISPKTEGISKVLVWKKKCVACGKIYNSTYTDSCNVCGSELKRIAKRK